jgi:hypothetical protein
MVQGVQLLDSKDNLDPQKMGASSTYARRYGYMAILGIAPEDDDAHIATKPPVKKVEEQKAPVHNTAGAPKEFVTTEKINILGEVQSQKYNTEKTRSEYTVLIGEGEQIVVFVKKPFNDFMECQKVEIVGYWTSDFKGKMYHMANDIKAVVSDETIPF